ncbi:uncharacterized protein [Watersipora subatra]|uniref:uncharacterized protein n=1 Tax=Watersipora subatra TaxID=2589382 RepID=UPI00355C6A0F
MHADGAALCAASQDDLQLLLNHFSEACSHLGLHISLKKTVTLSQSNEANIFSIDETVLQDVDKFTYLGSSLTQNTTLDHEIPRRLGFSSSTFGKLTGLVKAKTCVYEACVFSVLLCDSETWATYRPQKSKFSAFHIRSLRCILEKTWKDKLTNSDLFRLTGSSPLFTRLKFIRLCKAGHFNHLPADGIPRQLLHRELLTRASYLASY